MTLITSETALKPSSSRRWLKRFGWGLLWLFTLAILVIEIVNWRGRVAWKTYVASLEAKGERLDLDAIIPPPVPDAENFAEAPLFKPLFDYGSEDGSVIPKDPDERVDWIAKQIHAGRSLRNEKAVKALEDMKVRPMPKPGAVGNWRSGIPEDLDALADAYRKDSTYPHPSETSTSAETVLTALTKFDQIYAGFREACARPKSRFPLCYEAGVAMPVRQGRPLVNLAQLARCRALAELSLGNADSAFQDVCMILRSADAIQGEPVLISLLVRVVLIEIACQPLWEGMARHQWSDAQLVEMEGRLGQINLAAHYRLAIRGERITFLSSLDLMRRHPSEIRTLFSTASTNEPQSILGGPLAGYLASGWWDQNKATMGYVYESVLGSVDAHAGRFFPDRITGATIPNSSVFTQISVPVFVDTEDRCAFTQGNINMGRIAVALERHWLKHGSYPTNLESLDPEVKPAGTSLPADPATGRAVHYILSDSGFLLYCDGWNQKDDGGKIVWRDSKIGRVDPMQGDWVWPGSIAH